MNEIRICAVVTGRNLDDFLGNLEKIQQVADLVELRVDHIKSLSMSDIELIKSKTTRTAVFTCRKKEEGGLFEGSEQERIAIINFASMLGFEYIDIELSSADKFKELFQESKAKIILSFHDFVKTPALQELEIKKREMKAFSNIIMKFATFIKDDEDVNTLMRLLLNKRDGEKMIVTGMGEKSKLFRILGPLFGSYLTFASTAYSQSALGQIDIEELNRIYVLLLKES